MALSLAVTFSSATDRLAMLLSSTSFWNAPSLPRSWATCLIDRSMIRCATTRLSLESELVPPLPSVERKPSVLLPRLPVEIPEMPIEALSVSVTFDPSAKVAPPSVMSKSAAPELVLAAEVYPADQPDSATLLESTVTAQVNLMEAESGLSLEEWAAPPEAVIATLTAIEEAAADKGYHKAETLADCAAVGVRTYIPEAQRTTQRVWTDKPAAWEKAYRNNRRRVGESRSKRLQKLRSEKVERTFAHVCETGGGRRPAPSPSAPPARPRAPTPPPGCGGRCRTRSAAASRCRAGSGRAGTPPPRRGPQPRRARFGPRIP